MTFDKVKETIVEVISCDEDKITLEAGLKEDLGIDSLDAMELSMALEEKFNLTIEEEQLQTFVTVQNIVNFLDSQNV